jgi:hypothetical protein
MTWWRITGIAVLMMTAGCAYKVRLRSTPQPAEVTLPQGRTVLTPDVVRLRWVPFGHQDVTVFAPGYRPLTLDLREREVRLGRIIGQTIRHPSTLWGEVRGDVYFVLVPDHGPAGTWAEQDVP